MLTIKEIAEQLGITVSRARLAVKRAGVKPTDKTGRTLFYSDDDMPAVYLAHADMQTRKRRTNAKPTASTPTIGLKYSPMPGSQATLPPIDPVESDSKALPQSPSDM